MLGYLQAIKSLPCLMNALSCLSFFLTSGSFLCCLLAKFLLPASVMPYSPDRSSAIYCVSPSRTWMLSLLFCLAPQSLACSSSRYSGSCLFFALASLFSHFLPPCNEQHRKHLNYHRKTIGIVTFKKRNTYSTLGVNLNQCVNIRVILMIKLNFFL